MQHLPLPVSADEDEKVIMTLGKDPNWATHRDAWIEAYRRYQANSGSPFAITAHDFGDGVHDLQYDLYDTRKGSGELKRMRRKQGLKSCPVCGSTVIGSLDHYLPRTHFAEFSIMRANLIPSCVHCNSGTKGTTVHGGSPRRFIHPYYDEWAAEPLWFVEIVPPFKAARFVPKPLSGLVPPRDEIVGFHLENVLGTQFQLSMANAWSTLPSEIKVRDSQLTEASVLNELCSELRVAVLASTINGWRAALLRGVLKDIDAIKYVRQEALAAVLPPLP